MDQEVLSSNLSGCTTLILVIHRKVKLSTEFLLITIVYIQFSCFYNINDSDDQLSLGGCQTAVRADWSSGHGEKKNSDIQKVATSDETDNQEVPLGSERKEVL